MAEVNPSEYDATEGGFRYKPLILVRQSNVPAARAESELKRFGLDPDTVGMHRVTEGEFGIGAQTFYRYQYNVTYTYKRGHGDDAEYFPVEFRTFVYSTTPLSESFRRHIRLYDNPRLQEAFDSGPYENYMRGFSFFEKSTYIEDDEVAADEVSNLGIPQFEVLLHMDGAVQGHAGGFFDPFGIFRGAPKQTIWSVTKNTARQDYELRPAGRERDRLMRSDPKRVYLNGKYIGNTQPSRGSVYLSFDYSSNDNTWKNTATGQQMWSREKFTEEGLFHPNAVRAGGQVYKVSEDADDIVLVATKPDTFDPTPESAMPSTAGEAATLDFSETTEFDIRYDEGPMMSKYDAPTTRVIEDGTDLLH